MIPAYVGMKRLAELTDMSDDTIRRRMETHGFPRPKASGKWKWSEVEAWMDDGEAQAVALPPSTTSPDKGERIRNASKNWKYHS